MAKIAKHIKAQAERSKQQMILKTSPGVGDTLLGELPGFGILNNKEIAVIVGIARINRDSGKLRSKRRIEGGRATIRKALHIATFSITQCNPVIKAFYKKLVAQGKHKKVAITACVRMFITMLNATVRDNCTWAY